MAKTDTVQKIKRLHTHTVVFEAVNDVECACLALLGQTTSAIARETGLSESQVQYRVSKAGIKRWDFRNGRSTLAREMIERCYGSAQKEVEHQIAPKFAKYKG